MSGLRWFPYSISLLVLCLCAHGCQHENTQAYPDAFAPYVDEFFYQAQLHGLDIREEQFDFSIQFGATDADVGGFCNFDHNAVTVNPDEWAHRDEQQKEHLIFHELGHCILNRMHKNVDSPNGDCFSYMKGTENGFDCSINYYSAYWRAYYLDELFDPSTPLPEWYLAHQDYALSQIDYSGFIAIKDTLTDRYANNTFKFDQRDTFLFEIEFDNTQTSDHSMIIYLGNLVFSYCTDCTSSNTNLLLDQKRVFYTADIQVHDHVKLSVFRKNDIVMFFVNEYFVHVMEYDLIFGNQFKTRLFNAPIKMNIRYFYL